MSLRIPALLPVLLASGLAFAGDPVPAAAPVAAPAAAPAPRPAFADLDANKDASVDKTEAAKNETLAKSFDTLDGDKDGKLTQAEFASWK